MSSPDNTPTPDGRSSLLLCLSGPVQSWGSRSRHARRDTEPAPTLSGVLGIIANAQGRDRDDDLTDLNALSMRVRVDVPGVLLRDFQTIGTGAIKRANHWQGAPHLRDYGAARNAPILSRQESVQDDNPVLTEKMYLTGATFLIILTGPDTIIEQAADALDRPARAVYLGRKSCSPSKPILIGTSTEDPDTLLRTHPWLATPYEQQRLLRSHQHDHKPLPTAPTASKRPSAGGSVKSGAPAVPVQVTAEPVTPNYTLDTIQTVQPSHLWAEPTQDRPVCWNSINRTYTTRYIARDRIPLPPARRTATAPST